jgi:hypothetical protein
VGCDDNYRQISGLAIAANCRQLLQIAWFLSSKLKVAGSNPAGVTNENRGLAFQQSLFSCRSMSQAFLTCFKQLQ